MADAIESTLDTQGRKSIPAQTFSWTSHFETNITCPFCQTMVELT